jgi:DNA polymerase-3 subunit epsilon
MQNEELARKLEETGDYRVLRKFVPKDLYSDTEVLIANQRTVMVVDTETTGLNSETDKIIEIGIVLATFDRLTGRIIKVEERYSAFEDPGIPIPPIINRLTGIRDEDVEGQRFDDERVESMLQRADLVVAHNAKFDRGFLEKRFPSFAEKWWACSKEEAPWKEMLTGSTKLEWLAFHVGDVFFGAHRALNDAEVVLYLLSKDAWDGRPVFSHLLQKSSQKTYCIWAAEAPFEKREELKKLGYRWNNGSHPEKPMKAWYKPGVTDLEAELLELAKQVYPNGEPSLQIPVDVTTGRERFTGRSQKRDLFELPAIDAE